MNIKQVHKRYCAKHTITGCIELTKGTTARGGYSRIWLNGRYYLGHRYVFELVHGEIPKGMCICHKCDNPACVNINHLWIGTQADNIRDKVRKGNQTKGSMVNTAKLNEKQVAVIKYNLSHGESCTYLANKYGVKPVTISQIKTNRNWKHIKPHNRSANPYTDL